MMMAIAVAAMMLGAVASNGSNGRDAEEMLTLLQRHEIQVLLSVAIPMTDIAKRMGVSVTTVKRVRDEVPVTHVDDAAERRRRGIGRPSKAEPFVESVRTWLAAEPDLPTQELLRRAKERGYDGGKSAFYAMVSAARPPRSTPIVRFEGLPGEFSQHDFGQVVVRFVDGTQQRIHFFASRLKYSRFAAVTIVPNERTETLVRTLVRHFVAFGGVPLLAVFDRPRTIVSKSGRGREVEESHPAFAQVMTELGVGPEMCAPRSGWQKGSVEQLVKWVKSSFFKPRKFVDREDLEAQLAAWIDEVNLRTPNRATKEIPEARRQRELVRLRPVRLRPETLVLRVPVVVGPSAQIEYEGHRYSMPPDAASSSATALVYEDRIRFITPRHDVEHRRAREGDRASSSRPEDRAAKLGAVRGKRAVQYEKRQQLLEVGSEVETLITELVHREPKRQGTIVDDLYAMYATHGDERLRVAITAVVRRDTLTLEAVARELERGGPKRGGRR